MTRHYYAMFIPYGTDTTPGPYNYPTVFAFESKRQRDQVVENRWEHFATISAKAARKIEPCSIGWNFVSPDGTVTTWNGTQLCTYDQILAQ